MEVLGQGWLQKSAKSVLSPGELALLFAYSPRKYWCLCYVFHSSNQAMSEFIIAIHVPESPTRLHPSTPCGRTASAAAAPPSPEQQ